MQASKIQILWADDEIDLLKSQVLFLTDKGYEVTVCSNGHDALEEVKAKEFDVVFLDENMPGISGLETLTKIKEINNQIPVVMITKSEEENIMEEAIGSQIADYLIKPVKPNQILLSLKKIIDNKRLVSEKTTSNYRQEFQSLLANMSSDLNASEWADAFKKMIYWELELDRSDSREMQDVMTMQKSEASASFCKFVTKNYTSWVNDTTGDAPIMSNNLLARKVFPHLTEGTSTFLILIDNLRFDQWKTIQPILSSFTKLVEEESYYAILPTATQYARNAIFSGLMPSDIQAKYPDKWVTDEDAEGKNLHEEFFLLENLKRAGKQIRTSYTKVTNNHNANELANNMHNLMHNQLNVIVYNFMDMMSHVRTEMEVLKELASDEKAYRSLTASWFEHSPLLEALKKLEGKNAQIIITTDHGSVRVNQARKVVADKQTTTNLRYKTGKSIQFNPKEVFGIRKPIDAKLPTQHVSSEFIFAKEDDILVYANNFNHFANFYKNTFQHGGISLEEMIVPIIRLVTK